MEIPIDQFIIIVIVVIIIIIINNNNNNINGRPNENARLFFYIRFLQ